MDPKGGLSSSDEGYARQISRNAPRSTTLPSKAPLTFPSAATKTPQSAVYRVLPRSTSIFGAKSTWQMLRCNLILDKYLVASSWRRSRLAMALFSSSSLLRFHSRSSAVSGPRFSCAESLATSWAQMLAKKMWSATALVISSRPHWNRRIPQTRTYRP